MIKLVDYKVEILDTDLKYYKDIKVSKSGNDVFVRIKDDIFEISNDIEETFILALEVRFRGRTALVILTKIGNIFFIFEEYDEKGNITAINVQKEKLPRFTSRPKEISISNKEILISDGQEHLRVFIKEDSVCPMRYELYRIPNLYTVE